jgi:hypothetical protein
MEMEGDEEQLGDFKVGFVGVETPLRQGRRNSLFGHVAYTVGVRCYSLDLEFPPRILALKA